MPAHVQFNAVAFSIGPLSVHWYGLMYFLAFAQFFVLGRRRIQQRPQAGWTVEQLGDLLFYGVLSVIQGRRLGQVLFYEPGSIAMTTSTRSRSKLPKKTPTRPIGLAVRLILHLPT